MNIASNPMMTRTAALFALGLATGLAAPSCAVETTYFRDEHCANQDGDAWCAARYPDGSRGFCARGACVSTEDHTGCVAERPIDDECYSPCGGRASILEDGSCLSAQESSSSSGGSSGGGTETGSSGSSEGTESSSTGGVPCMGNEDCTSSDAPLCSEEGECVACDLGAKAADGDAACAQADADAPVCVAGACVPCSVDNVGACGGQTPVCGDGNTCAACTEHSQCPDSACHLDGAQVGACFDVEDVVEVANAAELDAALSGIGANEQAVLVLTGTDYAGVTTEISNDAEVALISSSLATVSGNSGFAVLGVSANAIVYLDGVTIGPNGTGNGIACSGTSVWLDDSEVRNNAQVGLDVSGGCAAHLRRTVVRANAGGGLVADGSTSSLELINSVVGDNVGGAAGPGIRVISSDLSMTYSAVVSNGTFAEPNNLECLSSATGRVSNSIVSGPNGDSIVTCDDIVWNNNAVDTDGLAGPNTNVGTYDAGWFATPGMGDFHLTETGEDIFMDIATWQDGDPLTDIDGDSIPTDGPSFPGYDQP